MSSALTFFFKEIFPTKQDFLTFFTEYDLGIDITVVENKSFAEYLYKILFRRYHNSNVQYDTPEDFKCDLANVVEDIFEKYQAQVKIAQKMTALTDEELLTVSTALANSANNPNTAPGDPTKPLDYIGAQAFTIAKSGKILGYLQALNSIPTKLIDEFLLSCRGLFKSILPNQIYLYGGRSYDNYRDEV